MASIYRNRSKWRAQIRLPGRRPISKVFTTKKEALAWVREMEGNQDRIDSFPNAEARRRTINDAINWYMAEYTGKDHSLVGRLSWWNDQLGPLMLAAITTARIKDCLRSLRGKSDSTINRYLAALSSVLGWAKEQEWLSINPALGITRRTEPKGRVRFLHDNEREALLKACDASAWPDLGLLVRLALSTGARKGELLRLEWRDIDLVRGVARLGVTKNGDSRVLPLVHVIVERLKARPQPPHGGLLFPSPRLPDRHFQFGKHWYAALREADIKDFRFHDLRHSCGSYLAMSGASTLEIADVLGHKSLEVVRRYSHLNSQHKAQLAERVLGSVVD